MMSLWLFWQPVVCIDWLIDRMGDDESNQIVAFCESDEIQELAASIRDTASLLRSSLWRLEMILSNKATRDRMEPV